MQHLLTLRDWSSRQIHAVLDLAAAVKREPASCENRMRRKTLFMIFEKPSLRTRVSFEVAMNQMGGHALYYDLTSSPLGAGKETIADTVRTVSRYGDLIMARVFEHAELEEMAAVASVPVINGLSNLTHPCQALADLLTIREKKGALKGRTLAYLGDGNNNVTHSLIFGCAKTGVNIRIGCPRGAAYQPQAAVLAAAGSDARATGCTITITHDAAEAARGADVIYTDSWMSYHIKPDKAKQRKKTLTPFQVNAALMRRAGADAIFMNCLPALRGWEQTADVIDGPQSVVFDQAENRLHTQKAVMLTLTAAAGRG